MPTELISKDEVVKALEDYAHFLIHDMRWHSATVAFDCLRIVRNLPVYGEE